MGNYKYLLDTSICIELLHGNEIVRRHCIDKNEECCISEITEIELMWGPYNAPKKYFEKELSKARMLCNFYECIPLQGVAEIFCEEKKRLKESGQSIEDFDLMIAATALANNLIVVTDNTSHFNRIQGLRLENWKY